ncbi:MAG: cobaltochelatase subunit CobN [Methanotrichaceae archaeon]|nr:cobaltochelatase subunit CobN [Methanotrichaceae archaeon]
MIYSQEPSLTENWTVADDLIFEVAINGSSPSQAQEKILGNISSQVSNDLNLSAVYAENLSKCVIEIPRVLDGLAGRYVPPKVANDPIRNPDALPTGNNFYSFDSRLIPGEEAWIVGRSQAEDLIAQYQHEHNGSYPQKTAFVLWAVETMRHQGVVESEIFQLLGVKPLWDSKGRISDVELIPCEELGRPRIDVLITASGLYRDTFPDKMYLLDRAVRLAAKANETAPNYVKESSEDILDQLLASGYNQSEAESLSSARIFSEALGTYGTGLPNAVSASDTWENDTRLADLYISRVSNVYSADRWGDPEKDLFSQNLADVEVAVHSDSSNLYGAIDNDDFFQYLGGLSLAIRSISGEDPDLYVTNLREPGGAKMESLDSYFRRELAARYFNPKWIAGMQEHGYAGAREMDKFVENLWGWEATVPDLVTESMWNEVHDVYIQDKYHMGLKKFFDQNNPYAYQALSGRLLETARKERWHPTEEVKKEMTEQYEQSVEDYGVTCCHHTCGNLALQEYMQGVLPLPEPEKSSRTSSSSSKSSSHKHSSASEKTASSNQTQPAGIGTTTTKQPVETEPEQSDGEVKGFVMEAAELQSSSPSISGAPLMGIALVLLALLVIAAGFKRKS